MLFIRILLIRRLGHKPQQWGLSGAYVTSRLTLSDKRDQVLVQSSVWLLLRLVASLNHVPSVAVTSNQAWDYVCVSPYYYYLFIYWAVPSLLYLPLTAAPPPPTPGRHRRGPGQVRSSGCQCRTELVDES